MINDIPYLIFSNGPEPTSFFLSNYGEVKEPVFLSGFPHSVLGPFLTELRGEACRMGLSTQSVYHPLDDSLQGLILPRKAAGVLGTDFYDGAVLDYRELIPSAELTLVRERMQDARQLFGRARRIHDRQEEIYLANMDFDAADRLAEETAVRLLGQDRDAPEGKEFHRFFGAATYLGAKDHLPELTGGLSRRYFLKGRPGTGKSTFLKKLGKAAVSRGMDAELYHCSLDVKSLDMVIVRELDLCVLDSTAPHEYFPTRAGDEIIDLYEACVAPGTDEKYERELTNLETAYRELVQTATACLREAREASLRYFGNCPGPDPALLEREKERLFSLLLE